VLNQTAIYAVRAMGFMAKQGRDYPILSSSIATEMNIPRNFLSKIINRLVQAGLVLASRGRGGGVKLARPAADIMLREVVELFMKVDDYQNCFIGLKTCDGSCGLHLRWKIISEQFQKMLDDTTVDQILNHK
jgi:Rrf2 family iron-sulfur cluster assembly transcriptional regulator